MSIVSKCGNHISPAARCIEKGSNFNADVQRFKDFNDGPSNFIKTQAKKNHSPIVITLDNSIEDNESNRSIVDQCCHRKRRRISSSGESTEERSFCVSPDFCRNSPATYKLRQVGERLLIVKVSMSSKQQNRRSLKCTDQDITKILDSDSDDLDIFDANGKSNEKVVTVLDNEKKTATPQKSVRLKKLLVNVEHDSPSKEIHKEILPQTPKRLQKNVADIKHNSPRGTRSRSKTLESEEVSLKIKLRRSTEQSNYKVATDDKDDEKLRRSTRSNVGTPKKCGVFNCDEDHSMHAITQGSMRGTSKTKQVLKESGATTQSIRNTRKNSKSIDYNNDTTEIKNIHNKENESEADNTMDDDSDSSSEYITQGKLRSATPQMKQKKILSDTIMTPKKISTTINETVTPRRNYLENVDTIEMSDIDEEIEGIARKKKVATPLRRQTRNLSVTPSTGNSTRPRRTSTTVSYNYDDLEDISYRNDKAERIKDKSATPLRQTKKGSETPSTATSNRPRRNSKSICYNENVSSDENKEETESNRETRAYATRRSSMTPVGPKSAQKRRKIPEEASTPKRTPGASSLRKSEEPTTPKRMTRASVLRNLEEPTTPKRTPRKSAIRELVEETMTPKRTPRKPPTIFEDDEPTTPNTKRRNFKALTPSIKHGNLTPSMTRRTANVGKPKTILEEARAQLHVSTVPKSLPCRDDEFNNIFRFLQSKLLDNSSGCIYISGVPGTGKTATVTEAIRALKRCVDKSELVDFQFVAINGMKLSEPRQAYVQILKQMTGETATWEQAHGILEKRFKKSNAKRSMTLLLVDELDLLCNKRQDVVYNLLDWPANAKAHLVVITIANTMDLPERILMSRVTSRLGLTRLTFQPYTYKQLQEIVTTRLKDSDAFRSEAIQLVSRKVAAVSGDARRALDICRRATEITEIKNEKIVTMQHVNEAVQEMISSANVKAIKTCSEMEIIFLRAVDAEITRTGVEEVTFHDIYRQFMSICAFEGIPTPNVTQATGISSRLSSYRLLLVEHTKNEADRRIRLNVSSDDIHFAMQTIGDS